MSKSFYKNFITFYVLGQQINLISDQTDYGLSTVAELTPNNFYYLGAEEPTLATAIMAVNKVYNTNFTDADLESIKLENL